MVKQKSIIWSAVAAVGIGAISFFFILQKGEEKKIRPTTQKGTVQTAPSTPLSSVPQRQSEVNIVNKKTKVSNMLPASKTATSSTQTSDDTLDVQIVERKIDEGELKYETDSSGYRREFYSQSGRYSVSVIVPTQKKDRRKVSYALPPAVPVVMTLSLPNGERVNIAIKNGYQKDETIVKIVDKESGRVTFKPVKEVEKEIKEEEGDEKVPLTPPPVPTLK